jgi:hypothetical protein
VSLVSGELTLLNLSRFAEHTAFGLKNSSDN